MSRVKPDRMCRKTSKKPETKNQQKIQGSQNNQSAADTECHDRCEKKNDVLDGQDTCKVDEGIGRLRANQYGWSATSGAKGKTRECKMCG